jgi:hypothetical protein
MSKKFYAVGILDNQHLTEVHCVINDLHKFIISDPDSYVFLTDNDGEQFRCKKNQVQWLSIKPW